MTISLKLVLFRRHRKLKSEEAASQIGIDIELYNKLEQGTQEIDLFTAQKISDFYQAPLELFLLKDNVPQIQAEVVYTNCNFSGGGSNGYINNQYNDRGIEEIIFSKKEEIKSLNDRNKELTKENARLLKIIDKKK